MGILKYKILRSRFARFIHTTSWCTCAPHLIYIYTSTTLGLWIVGKKKLL